MELPLIVEIKGRDCLKVTSLDPFKIEVIACHHLMQTLNDSRRSHGENIKNWPLPAGTDHSNLLIKELILKLNNKWKHVYTDDEVCHCRTISLETIELAIFHGATTAERVTQMTTASSACGTCRPDVEKILKFRLGDGT